MTPEQEIPNSHKYTLVEEKGKGGNDYLYVQELEKCLPIYDLRNLDHHPIVAKMLAQGSTIAMYGGVWAVIKAEKRHLVNSMYASTTYGSPRRIMSSS